MKRFFSKTRFPSYYKDNERKGEKQRGIVVDTGAGVVILGSRFVIPNSPSCHSERSEGISLVMPDLIGHLNLSFRACREISSSNSALYEDELFSFRFSSSPEAVFKDEMRGKSRK